MDMKRDDPEGFARGCRVVVWMLGAAMLAVLLMDMGVL